LAISAKAIAANFVEIEVFISKCPSTFPF
jgi:hypothetical protein